MELDLYEWLGRELVFGRSAMELAILAFVVAIVARIFRYLLRGKKETKLIKKTCAKCKWTGPAARQNKVCGHCKGPLCAG